MSPQEVFALLPDAKPPADDTASEDWPRNYFNYFTEIEDHFQRVRGTGLFLLSPLDWALIDNWRISGIPLEAALKGIDEAFRKWNSRKQRRRLVNSLAYCAQAVMECAQRSPSQRESALAQTEPLFEVEQIDSHLLKASALLLARPEAALAEVATALQSLASGLPAHLQNLEALEQRLTALEERVVAILRASQSNESLLSLRQKLDIELKPYRSKMSADQLATLERRYLDTALLELAQLPRLSLFYLH